MKKCPKCQNLIDESAQFCPKCGTNVTLKECPNCHRMVDEKAAFCTGCGTNLAEPQKKEKECPNCHKTIDENAVFCTKCGHRVDGKEPLQEKEGKKDAEPKKNEEKVSEKEIKETKKEKVEKNKKEEKIKETQEKKEIETKIESPSSEPPVVKEEKKEEEKVEVPSKDSVSKEEIKEESIPEEQKQDEPNQKVEKQEEEKKEVQLEVSNVSEEAKPEMPKKDSNETTESTSLETGANSIPSAVAIPQPVPNVPMQTPYPSYPGVSLEGPKPNKKKSTGKVIAIILIIVLLLVAIAVGVWYFFFRDPDTKDTNSNSNVVEDNKEDLAIEEAYDFSGNIAAVKVNGKWGFIDSQGNVVVDFQYDSVFKDYQSGLLIPVKKGEYWGFIDEKGVAMTEFQYDIATLFLAERDDVSYFINDSGEETEIPYSGYNSYKIVSYDDQNVILKSGNGNYGVLKRTGELVIPINYSWMGSKFSENNVIVASNGNDVYLFNRDGEELRHLNYEEVGQVSDGLIRVVTRDSSYNKLYGFMNDQGEVVIALQFKDADDYHDGYAAVAKENYFGPYGLIDKTGKLVLDYVYHHEPYFSNGLSDMWDQKTGLYGYIDITGKVVIDYQYDEAQPFDENGVAVVTSHGQKLVIDKTGKVVYTGDCKFVEGLAKVSQNNQNELYGFIDPTGQVVIDYQYSDAHDFHEGLAAVSKDGKWMYVNSKNEVVISGIKQS